MSRSIEYPLAGPRPNSWIRQAPIAVESDGPKIAFKLLILFLLVLYSNIAVVYKALDAFRPALVVAVAALGMMVLELAQTRRRFQLIWPQGFLLVGFLGIAFISSFDAMWVRLAFERTSDIAKIVLIYVVIENTVTTESRLRTIMLTMVFAGLIPAIGTIDRYVHGILVEGSRGAWKGLFGNPNEAAYGLLVLIPIAAALAGKSRWFLRVTIWGVMAICLLAIFLTFSRGGLMGLFVVLGLVGWKQKSVVLKSLMIAGLIGSVFVVSLYWSRSQSFKDISQDTTYNQRIATIRAGIRMFEANPLLGVGPGCSIVAYPIYVPPEAHCGCQLQLVIHNSFVQVLSETGFPGFALFMLFLGISIFDARKMQKGPLSPYAAALEVALWGFVICSLSGGFTYTWWPYILIGLVAAMKHIAASDQAKGANAVV